MKKTSSGVTLIALIITIIVLLILAGVTIAMIMGDNGILNQAMNAADETNRANVQSELEFIKASDIDWELRRYEIAKDMMAAFLSNYSDNIHSGNPDEQAKYAVIFADALIAELKKGGVQ